MTSAQDRQAYDLYHARYGNTTYVAIQKPLVADVFGEKVAEDAQAFWNSLKQEPVHSILNAVTDAALDICGLMDYQGALHRLSLRIIQHRLSDESIQVIAEHLRNFEDESDTKIDDFVASLSTIQQTIKALDVLQDGIACASMIHNKEGRTAFYLLSAMQAYLSSAVILLKEGDSGYCREKLGKGDAYLVCAKQELD